LCCPRAYVAVLYGIATASVGWSAAPAWHRRAAPRDRWSGYKHPTAISRLGRIYLGFVHYAEVNDSLRRLQNGQMKRIYTAGFRRTSGSTARRYLTGRTRSTATPSTTRSQARNWNGKKLAEMPDAEKTPLVFDSSTVGRRTRHDPLTSLPRPGRHGGRNNILYC